MSSLIRFPLRPSRRGKPTLLRISSGCDTVNHIPETPHDDQQTGAARGTRSNLNRNFIHKLMTVGTIAISTQERTRRVGERKSPFSKIVRRARQGNVIRNKDAVIAKAGWPFPSAGMDGRQK